MAKSRMVQVAEQLLQKSRAGTVTWEPVEGRENAYQVSFPDATLVLSRRSPLRDSPWATVRDLSHSLGVDVATYRLELLDEANQAVESLLAVPGQSTHRMLREAFGQAQRGVRHSEENIDKVMGYLSET